MLALSLLGRRAPKRSMVSSAPFAISQARLLSTYVQDPWRSVHRAYCINLDRRAERWAFMQKQFERLNLPVQRWSAVDGKSLDIPALADAGFIAQAALPRFHLPDEQKLFGTDLTRGGIGCALSHMLIWKDIIRQHTQGGADDRSMFLVCEDDCQFADQFSQALVAERLRQVPDDWEMVYLGGQDLLHRGHLHEVAPGVRRLYKGFRETTAYIIRVAGAKACLEVCIPMYWQVDTHLNDESLREGLRPSKAGEKDFTMHPRGYYLWPAIVAQQREGFPTDVQTMEHD